MADMDPTFSESCWTVFSVILVICAIIGIYFMCTGGRQRSVEEFFMADRSANWAVVAASLFSR